MNGWIMDELMNGWMNEKMNEWPSLNPCITHNIYIYIINEYGWKNRLFIIMIYSNSTDQFIS